MGRPQKQNAEYFPHYTEKGKTMFILENQWGNDGYAFWYKLMEQLCVAQGHFYDFSMDENKVYMAACCRLPESQIEEIISTLAKLGEIDKELWEKGRIIWCQQLVDSLEPLYKKRTVSIPKKPVLGAKTTVTAQDDEMPGSQPEEKPKHKLKKEQPPKKQYAEFVFMRERDYEKLVEEYGEQRTRRMIEILDNYKGSKGKKYADDYRAILNWVVKRLLEEEHQNGGMMNGYGTNGQHGGGFTPSGGFRNS